MNKYILSFILMISLVEWSCTFTIGNVEFELLDDKFRLSLPNDPDIKWVSFHVNINKEFRSFETGQLVGEVSMPRSHKWSHDFDKSLEDTDIVYVWLAVQHNRFIFRDRKEPISVETFKSGNPNYRITTEKPGGEESTTATIKPINVKICHRSVSVVPKSFGGTYCRDDLIFSDDFNNYNLHNWTNEIRIPPSTNDAEFVVYNGTIGVDSGILKIEASSDGSFNLKKGEINLRMRCTSLEVETECYRKVEGVLFLPPIVSGRISTKDHFSFKYGRIEVRAKLPKGDWLYPLISLQPSSPAYGKNYKSGEMRVAYARGNLNLNWQNKNIDGGRLFGGAIVNKNADTRHQFMKDTTLPNVQHFGDNFHLYSLKWTPEELVMSVDGNEYGRVPTNFKQTLTEPVWNKGEENAPLDQMFYITLGLAAGGNGDFPDTEGKPWNNTDPRGLLYFFSQRRNWHATWSQPSLEVDYVRVYAV